MGKEILRRPEADPLCPAVKDGSERRTFMAHLCSTQALFDLSRTMAAPLLAGTTFPWEALAGLEKFIFQLGESLSSEQYERMGDYVWAAKTARIAKSAYLGGPCIIGPGTEVRHGAFIRGAALVGEGCVVGNSVELKNCVLFDGAQVPHFNYVGDSVLGWKAHLGAGAVTSNVKSDKSLVVVKAAGEELPTGRKKVGAMVGDGAEVGCNSVLCPGSVLGRGAQVYPTSCVRGYVPENHIYKAAGNIVARR